MEKEKEKEERKQKKGEKKEKETDENEHESEGAAAEEANGKFELPKGSLVHFTGTSATTTREIIKKSLMELGGEVAYIDYEMGKSEGWIRLQDANSGKALVDKMTDGKVSAKIIDHFIFAILPGYLKSNPPSLSFRFFS